MIASRKKTLSISTCLEGALAMEELKTSKSWELVHQEMTMLQVMTFVSWAVSGFTNLLACSHLSISLAKTFSYFGHDCVSHCFCHPSFFVFVSTVFVTNVFTSTVFVSTVFVATVFVSTVFVSHIFVANVFVSTVFVTNDDDCVSLCFCHPSSCLPKGSKVTAY